MGPFECRGGVSGAAPGTSETGVPTDIQWAPQAQGAGRDPSEGAPFSEPRVRRAGHVSEPGSSDVEGEVCNALPASPLALGPRTRNGPSAPPTVTGASHGTTTACTSDRRLRSANSTAPSCVGPQPNGANGESRPQGPARFLSIRRSVAANLTVMCAECAATVPQ